MKEITYFYLESCPFCLKADQIIEELKQEHPEFTDVTINKIEESKQEELASQYPYYFVPCMFVGNEKLHEGIATKRSLENTFARALS